MHVLLCPCTSVLNTIKSSIFCVFVEGGVCRPWCDDSVCVYSLPTFHDVSLHSCKLTISQMLGHTWIQIALFSLLMVYSASTQSCSFDAAFTIIDDRVEPASIVNEFPDPQMGFFRDVLHFTEAETQQVVWSCDSALQHTVWSWLLQHSASQMMETSDFLEMQGFSL